MQVSRWLGKLSAFRHKKVTIKSEHYRCLRRLLIRHRPKWYVPHPMKWHFTSIAFVIALLNPQAFAGPVALSAWLTEHHTPFAERLNRWVASHEAEGVRAEVSEVPPPFLPGNQRITVFNSKGRVLQMDYHGFGGSIDLCNLESELPELGAEALAEIAPLEGNAKRDSVIYQFALKHRFLILRNPDRPMVAIDTENISSPLIYAVPGDYRSVRGSIASIDGGRQDRWMHLEAAITNNLLDVDFSDEEKAAARIEQQGLGHRFRMFTIEKQRGGDLLLYGHRSVASIPIEGVRYTSTGFSSGGRFLFRITDSNDLVARFTSRDHKYQLQDPYLFPRLWDMGQAFGVRRFEFVPEKAEDLNDKGQVLTSFPSQMSCQEIMEEMGRTDPSMWD